MSDVPDEFIPEKPAVLADHPECPGCGGLLGPAALEYCAVEYDGDTWHVDCACEDHPEFTRETPRYCPNCYAFSPWHRDGTPPTARRCHGCGWRFKNTPTKDEVLDETGGVL